MAIRHGDREQLRMFPASIDEYVSDDDPVRVYDVFVGALDIKALGIVIEDNKVGNPAYDPKSMLKLLVYGYSYGWRSSRKLEMSLSSTCFNIARIITILGIKKLASMLNRYAVMMRKSINREVYQS